MKFSRAAASLMIVVGLPAAVSAKKFSSCPSMSSAGDIAKKSVVIQSSEPYKPVLTSTSDASGGQVKLLWGTSFRVAGWPGGKVATVDLSNAFATTSCGRVLSWDYVWGKHGEGVVGIKDMSVIPESMAKQQLTPMDQRGGLLAQIPGYRKVSEVRSGDKAFGLYSSTHGAGSLLSVIPNIHNERPGQPIKPLVVLRLSDAVQAFTAAPDIHDSGSSLTFLSGPNAQDQLKIFQVYWSVAR